MSTPTEISRRRAVERISLTIGTTAIAWSGFGANSAQGANALPHVQIPNDRRLGRLKDLNGYFPLNPPSSRAEWEARREYVKRQILVSCGLWPMPPRPSVQASIHGRVERPGYTIDRVLFESSPGLYVTGSLYRPANASGRLPTILCPHGHFTEGRFHDHGPDQIQQEIQSGGEKFPKGGRHPLQARCVQLARMGCQVFIYDMQGYADGGSFTSELIHGFAKQRPDMSAPSQWGLFSAQSELRAINAMGLQTWNSLRVLDWLLSRDDVDSTRIGVTGASGGGTQTFILAALDDRVTAAFPAVMVSTAMQGGCTCENASYLRVNTGNIEIAGLIAPRPLGMTGANDWTVDIETKGLPELKHLYTLLGEPDNVTAKYYSFPHNYNAVSRAMMYEFFNHHFHLQTTPIQEEDFEPLTREEATVYSDSYPSPIKDNVSEIAILRAIDRTSRQQMATLYPQSSSRWNDFRQVVGGALEVMIGRPIPSAQDLEFELRTEVERNRRKEFTAWLRNVPHGEELPTTFLLPDAWNKQVVLWLTGIGKQGLYSQSDELITPIEQLLGKGYAVASADLLYQGEYLANGIPLTATRSVDNPREFLGYTLGYNHPLFAQRVHDILTLLSFIKSHDSHPEKIQVVGTGIAGIWCAAAVAVAGANAGIERLAVETGGFRFAKITEIRDLNLLPGAVKYGDLPALLALCAPTHLAIGGEAVPTLTAAAYATTGGKVEALPVTSKQTAAAFADWILS